ncbi:hypothetical protein YT1_3370 [Rhodococcus ruber]|nr:hypothetical protein YT1_3370 [Rhodococcus ruber]
MGDIRAAGGGGGGVRQMWSIGAIRRWIRAASAPAARTVVRPWTTVPRHGGVRRRSSAVPQGAPTRNRPAPLQGTPGF